MRPVVCRDASYAQGHETQRHNSESEQIRTLLERQREQILADCQAEIRKHEFQADCNRRSIQKLNETIESQKEEICRAHQGDERRRQDQQLLHGKKRLLTIRAVMLEQHVDLVAGDFNGAAWRRATSADIISIIEEAFADCDLPMPPGPTPLWGPGAVLGTWADVCGFLKPPDSNKRWRVRQHGAFPIHHELWASDRPIRAAITRFGFTWILWSGAMVKRITEDTNDDSS